MVSSRLGNFLKRTSAYVGEGRAVNEADILLQLKFQHHLTPEKVSSPATENAHVLKFGPKGGTEAERTKKGRQAAYLYANWIDCANMRG